jgi:hypothetical protein
MTQEQRILEILGDNRWHCGNEFLAAYMPRYSAVIYTLRKAGYGIAGVRCDSHSHRGPENRHSVFMFRLEQLPANVMKREQLSWL